MYGFKTNNMKIKIIKLFLRLSIASAYLNAVFDRFGMISKGAAWGNWDNFVQYTKTLLPWFNTTTTSFLAVLATVAEIIIPIGLILGWKTRIFALLSGFLLLTFGLAMTFSLGISKPLAFSVFSASAASFALSEIKTKFWEIKP